MKILISSGATREKIDQIRYISNISTGSTGAYLAEKLFEAKHEVIYLHGLGAMLPNNPEILKIDFSDFDSLNERFITLLREMEFDYIIHAAAVSDYKINKIFINGVNVENPNKLASNQNLTLELTSNFKILSKLKDYANYPFNLIGFKLTHDFSKDEELNAISKLFKESKVDYVIHNDYRLINHENHPFKIYNQDLKNCYSGQTKEELFKMISLIIGDKK